MPYSICKMITLWHAWPSHMSIIKLVFPYLGQIVYQGFFCLGLQQCLMNASAGECEESMNAAGGYF